jgi:acetyl-CoA carboxylase carboxyl transferase subunit beta
MPAFPSVDPLGFSDPQARTGSGSGVPEGSKRVDAVRSGLGKVDGMGVSIAVMDFDFIGGSMGSVVGEKITRAIERGLELRLPVIVVSTSGGARMQEGILSLMQMAKTSAALARLGQAGVPYISILTHPTTAGVMASYASLGDVIIAEPDALIGFAGPRVIEQTINQILPKGFQKSGFVLDHGFIDIVCPRKEMRPKLINLLRVLRPRDVSSMEVRQERVSIPSKAVVRSGRNGSSAPIAAVGRGRAASLDEAEAVVASRPASPRRKSSSGTKSGK